MAADYLFELSPLDHIVARIYTSYALHFNTQDTEAARRTIENGVQRLISHVPFLAGDVTLSKAPETPKNRARISLSPLALDQIPIVQVKYHDEYKSQDTSDKALHPLPLFLPFSKPAPILRFQVNIFQKDPRVVLVMSFHHHVMDGSGAEQVLKAFAECCRVSDNHAPLPIASAIAESESCLREKVSAWTSECVTRIDHSNDFGPDIFGVDVSAEQFAQLAATMAAAVTTKKFSFSSEKIRQLKDVCNSLESSPSVPISSNDLFTALLAISIDQAQNPAKAEEHKLDGDSACVMMIVDMRARIRPPLPRSYLGNMILPVRADLYPSDPNQTAAESASDDESENQDLRQVARLAANIRGKLHSMNEADIYSVAAMIAAQDDWAATGGKPANAFFTSWRHLGVYELNFGEQLGQIMDFGTDSGLMAGVCIVLPPRLNGGDIKAAPWEVNITMKPESFDLFERDPLVRRILS